jgi:hypothetical protein
MLSHFGNSKSVVRSQDDRAKAPSLSPNAISISNVYQEIEIKLSVFWKNQNGGSERMELRILGTEKYSYIRDRLRSLREKLQIRRNIKSSCVVLLSGAPHRKSCSQPLYCERHLDDAIFHYQTEGYSSFEIQERVDAEYRRLPSIYLRGSFRDSLRDSLRNRLVERRRLSHFKGKFIPSDALIEWLSKDELRRLLQEEAQRS